MFISFSWCCKQANTINIPTPKKGISFPTHAYNLRCSRIEMKLQLKQKKKRKKRKKRVLKSFEDLQVCWTPFINYRSMLRKTGNYLKRFSVRIRNITWKISLFTRCKGDCFSLLNFGPIERAYASLPHQVISSKGWVHAIYIINLCHPLK